MKVAVVPPRIPPALANRVTKFLPAERPKRLQFASRDPDNSIFFFFWTQNVIHTALPCEIGAKAPFAIPSGVQPNDEDVSFQAQTMKHDLSSSLSKKNLYCDVEKKATDARACRDLEGLTPGQISKNFLGFAAICLNFFFMASTSWNRAICSVVLSPSGNCLRWKNSVMMALGSKSRCRGPASLGNVS